MVPALGIRRFVALFSLLSIGLTTGISAGNDDQRGAGSEFEQPALLDNETWFASVLAARAESLQPAPAQPPVVEPPTPGTIRPRVQSPNEPASDPVSPFVDRPTIPDAPTIADDMGPADDTRFTLFRRSRRSSFARRRRPIAVLGDSLLDAGQMDIQFTAFDYATWPATPVMASASTDIPLIATATRTKVAENSSVLPTDRLIFSYQHFQNARFAEVINPVAGDTSKILNVDRLTIGLEKTFFDGRWSIDMRLPVNSRFDVSATDFGLTNGRLGNASLLVKHLLAETEAMSLGLGVGIDAPTGRDGQVTLPNSEAVISNDAYHAMPYVGLLFEPNDNLVVQAFAQLDIPLNGNEIEVKSPSAPSAFGRFDEQELIFLSLSVAKWLHQDSEARYLRGLAALVELHHTTSLDTSDSVTVSGGGDSYEFSNPSGDISNLNLTAGILAQIGATNVRVATVVPMLTGDRRAFDAELLLQINRPY